MSKTGEAKLSVSYGRTVNTGNYESVRIDVALEVPLENGTKKECDEKYERLLDWCRGKVATEEQEWKQ